MAGEDKEGLKERKWVIDLDRECQCLRVSLFKSKLDHREVRAFIRELDERAIDLYLVIIEKDSAYRESVGVR